MKTLVLLASLVSIAAAAQDCEYVTERSLPQAAPPAKKTVPRAPAATKGPRLHVTPYKPVTPFAPKPPVVIRTIHRYDCPPPMSLPPGGIRIGGGIPYVGPRPVWYPPTPYPGPQPVWPGSPDDFPPGVTIPPPSGIMPPPTDVPEPPAIALFLVGLIAMNKRVRSWALLHVR